jgi:hypothetical protein
MAEKINMADFFFSKFQDFVLRYMEFSVILNFKAERMSIKDGYLLIFYIFNQKIVVIVILSLGF